jgi:hypothetical protein
MELKNCLEIGLAVDDLLTSTVTKQKSYSDFVNRNGTDHAIGNLQKVELE